MEGGGAPPLPMHPGGGVHNSWLVTAQYNRVSMFPMWPVNGWVLCEHLLHVGALFELHCPTLGHSVTTKAPHWGAL